MIGAKLTSWVSHRGFGFLGERDDGQPPIFVHIRELESIGVMEPELGLRVMFDVGQRQDGKLYATNLKKVA